MTLEDIRNEFERHGRLSDQAVSELRKRLRSADPYSAISVTADCAATELSEELLPCLDASDQMVRWNAVAALFTRFRDTRYVSICKRLANEDPSSMVRAVALCGIGEVLPRLQFGEEAKQLAALLLQVLLSETELPEIRAAAYEGILAAQGVPPLERPAASQELDVEQDVERSIVDNFRAKWLPGGSKRGRS